MSEGLRSTALTAAKSCKNSFTAETPVAMADGSQKPISEVEVGDEVVATDPDTGESGARPVVELIRHGGEHTMVDLAFDDGSVVSATDGHPFWDVSAGLFTEAVDLQVGELVLALDGRSLQVASVRVYGEDLVAYNLEIGGIHTYYAGETPVLVHNSCGSNLASEARTNHILDGDATGGGHLWPGQPGKTPFPSTWSGEDVMDAISEVVTSSNSVIGASVGGRTSVYGNVNGVLIKVVTDWADIITAHPVPWGR